MAERNGKRVLIFIVAYNAEATIEKVLDRIPRDLRLRLRDPHYRR